MEPNPFDPYYHDENEIPLDEPEPQPVPEPGWWQLIGGAWRWMTDPTE